MVSLSGMNVASTLIGQSLASMSAAQSQGTIGPLLSTNQNLKLQDADSSFSVDLTQSLSDKQMEARLTIDALALDVSAAQERGADLEAAFLTLAKTEYSKISRALSDDVESRNEEVAALAVEGLNVASLENVKDMIAGTSDAEVVDAEVETEDEGQALDEQAKEAQEAAEALKDLPV